MMQFTEEWQGCKIILVILAHPDDPEFFLGATIARWSAMGHIVHYCLLTHGDKGAQDLQTHPEQLSQLRAQEQRAAAAILGVHSVSFLNYFDGYLEPDLAMRKDVVRVIRQMKPDIVVSSDPLNVFPGEVRINHPDHRAAGLVVVDSVYPAAGNPFFFPELIHQENLLPHSVKEVWLSVTNTPTITLDVTEYWEKKLQALLEHRSQIGDPVKFEERMRSRWTQPVDAKDPPRFEEKFRRIMMG